MPEKFFIPNCLENWKWPRHLNPHYPEVKAESAAWVRSFGAFSPKAQHAYDRCEFSKPSSSVESSLGAHRFVQTFSHPSRTLWRTRVSLGYSHLGTSWLIVCSERLRTGCDMMNMVFVFDEYSDVSPTDEVQKQADVIMDALRNPHTPRPKGEWIGGEVARQWVLFHHSLSNEYSLHDLI